MSTSSPDKKPTPAAARAAELQRLGRGLYHLQKLALMLQTDAAKANAPAAAPAPDTQAADAFRAAMKYAAGVARVIAEMRKTSGLDVGGIEASAIAIESLANEAPEAIAEIVAAANAA